ncbi:PREDICTED: F-box protein At1g30790-like [Camelina sativa]|uniref:F-box protein At1g30790-like n=1 Tax=Camelina sativa TaxID=90675 RepID=A0ABM0X4L9_CAMSA|nr:PREDICTED: F-box protein At1g30790-like [Camelina sativa]
MVLLGTAIKSSEVEDEKDKLEYSIPYDLEVEILSRLPTKSMMKARCVSKIWSSIIRSQRFVDSYYTLSLTRSRFIVTLCNGDVYAKRDVERLLIFSSSFEEEKSSSLVATLDMTIPSVVLNYNFKCPSIHGFLGCCSSRFQFIVCNPTTRQVITLPIKGIRASLGYDPVGRQFKALNLVTRHELFPDFLVHEVITFGGRGEVSRKKVTTAPYYPVADGLYINGYIYYAAWAPMLRMDPVIVCFDVRYEKISFINAPRDVVFWEFESILIDYRGKLASISIYPYAPFQSFGLWILEDAMKHDWSKQTFELPFPLVDVTSPGTNKAGEIIFTPKYLLNHGQPFFIFYYNVEKKNIRSVRLHGVVDDEEFWRRYGLLKNMTVTISPEHVESIASL